MRCGSWPHCDAEAMPGRRFCEVDQAVLDRLKEGRKVSAPKVKPEKPKPKKAPKPPRAPDPRVLELQDAILAALRSAPNGELPAGKVMEAVGVGNAKDGPYRAARDLYELEGRSRL